MATFLAIVLSLSLTASAAAPNGSVKFQVVDDAQRQLLPARVHITGPDKKPVEVPGLPFYRDHVNTSGEFVVSLAPGTYEFTVERGPEYERVHGQFEIVAGERLIRRVFLNRLIDLSSRGWWSGDLHIHRQLEDVELLARSEDLHVAPVLTVWNQRNLWAERRVPEQLLKTVDPNRWIHALSCEDERGGGALLYFNLERPLNFQGDGREFPSPLKNLEVARSQPHVWIDIEKPFWWDVPTWIGTGRIDSIGIANNHMCRSTMYPDEAWGRPRDASRLPSPRGNGFYTQELYYRILDCGFRIPPSAGSASGVLPNPVGYNRVYVHLGNAPSYSAWWKGLAKGHSFVTNGPLLLATASGQLPGKVFQAAEGEVFEFDVEAEIVSNDPVEYLEVIANGVVVQRVERPALGEPIRIKNLTLKEPGWFLIRCIADVSHTFRFASTAPFYVEYGERRRRIESEDVEFFSEWIKTRMRTIKERAHETVGDQSVPENAARLESVLAPHRKALRFFSELQQIAR